jgi:NagD protein
MKKGLMIDMDGVIYEGERLIPGADKFTARLKRKKIPFLFLSNNSKRTRAEAVEKLAGLGIAADEKDIYTSAMATGEFLAREYAGARAFVLGEGGLLTSLTEHGIQLVDSEPDLVILGEGDEFTLKRVHQAVDMILAGARFISTNKDPSPRRPGWNNLGITAVNAMIEEATGRKAFVIGKPSPLMLGSASAYLGLRPNETTVIGDTMETDILGAFCLGYKTILVLSGIAEEKHLVNYGFKPSLVVHSVNDIKFPLDWW